MTYSALAKHAQDARRLAAAAARLKREGQTDKAFENLALAVEQLSAAVGELGQALDPKAPKSSGWF